MQKEPGLKIETPQVLEQFKRYFTGSVVIPLHAVPVFPGQWPTLPNGPTKAF
jgi:hypothetical protein